MHRRISLMAAGAIAGAFSGFFGAGGGAVLVPLLEKSGKIPEERIFSSSLLIMGPVCLVSLLGCREFPALSSALPYLLGSFLGGLLSRPAGKRISPSCMHRIFGGILLLGGVRMLWNGH